MVFATEAVVHKCSSKWPERPPTLLKKDSNVGVFLWNLRNILRTPVLQTPLVAASVAKTGHRSKETRENILRKDLYEYFCWNMVMKYYHSEVMKNQVTFYLVIGHYIS